MICLLNLCCSTDSTDLYVWVHDLHVKMYHTLSWISRGAFIKGGDRPMDKEYVLVYTPYITRKGVRIWASQYGLKAFCLRIPREKYRG